MPETQHQDKPVSYWLKSLASGEGPPARRPFGPSGSWLQPRFQNLSKR
jgi:hypothetical protein